MELTSDNGKVHATVEDPEAFKEMGIDVLEEAKALMEYQEKLEGSICIDELTGINENLVYLGDRPEQYKDAIVGITYDGNHIVYSVEKFTECLMKEGMTEEDATEWIGYNTARAISYMGEYAPILMNEMES